VPAALISHGRRVKGDLRTDAPQSANHFEEAHELKRVRFLSAATLFAALAVVLIEAASAQYPGGTQDPNIRRRYMPVTLTQQGWRAHARDLVYPGFRFAFARFSFYGKLSKNHLVVGRRNIVVFDANTASLSRLCLFLPQTGPSGSLSRSYVSPWSATEAGALAGEVVALTMNVAYNDERLMPRQPGYDLELFVVAQGPFRRRTVGQVLDIANRILGGDSPRLHGLPNHEAMTAVLRAINSNYEFIDYDTFYDRGYLIPNRYGLADPPHAPHVPRGAES